MEKLPTPFGLVRSGVAPDHQDVEISFVNLTRQVKSVQTRFTEISINPAVRYFGNVTVGKDISVETLRSLYPVVVFTTGAEGNKELDIPGARLRGIHYARDFVGWYNCLPENKDDEYDLSGTSAVIIGNSYSSGLTSKEMAMSQ